MTSAIINLPLHDGPAEIRRMLGSLGVEQGVIDEVVSINENISFSKGKSGIAKE